MRRVRSRSNVRYPGIAVMRLLDWAEGRHRSAASVNESRVATALGCETATTSATDSESPANCPAQWYAQLEVR